MSNPIHVILICFFLVCEALAAFLWAPAAEPYRLRLVALGLFFFALAQIF